MDVFEELVRLRRQGRKCALATIVDVRGSIPSYATAKLLVRDDGSMAGTIGGGCVEADVWSAAREVMETEKSKRLTFNLGQDAAYDNGLICGGQLDVFIEPVLPAPRAYIFGAGHISKSLSKIVTMAGFASVVIDDREAFASRERFPEAEEVHAAEYEELFPKLAINETSYLIIVTRGHRDDMRVLKLAIATPARYIAMIGSKRKVIGVIRELEKEGVPRAAFERLHAPMGLDIGAVSPEEIAISVTAEMIAVRRNAESNWRALSMSVCAAEARRAAVLAK
jgi:xanthine dehydrogenase accessory factor